MNAKGMEWVALPRDVGEEDKLRSKIRALCVPHSTDPQLVYL